MSAVVGSTKSQFVAPGEPSLGVCYYPEQWPESTWESDFARMKDLGLTYVRMFEFSWYKMEPQEGKFNWEWIDKVLDLCTKNGLKVIMGTPTATPPKWLVDSHPDILPVADTGDVRKFGSRRHYTTSSDTYRKYSERITTEMAQRYANHAAVVGWQLDNEFGCHDTVRSYSPEDLKHFRNWISDRYKGSIDALNTAWGTTFWSQEYHSFDQVDLPNLTVTEANPAHWLDFYRFASDYTVSYAFMQAEIIRKQAPGHFITTNFMGLFFDFDHYKMMQSYLDFATWDNYPLGFLAISWLADKLKAQYGQIGHPDLISFHHDLYRGLSSAVDPSDPHRRCFWVMEQQPGPINWAPYNPLPAPHAVRFWSWEAIAHGANVVSYFRWRQAPFSQEQNHAGLLRPDSKEGPGFADAKQLLGELSQVKLDPYVQQGQVAILFDYESEWILKTQRQGDKFSYIELIFNWYSSIRANGVNVDIVSQEALLNTSSNNYKVIIIPTLPVIADALVDRIVELGSRGVRVVCGVRTGSKTTNFQIPTNLAPGALQKAIPIKITQVGSWHYDNAPSIIYDGRTFTTSTWTEDIETKLSPVASFTHSGTGAIYQHNSIDYIAFWPSDEFLKHYTAKMLTEANVPRTSLLAGFPSVRIQHRGGYTFVFNYGNEAVVLPAASLEKANFIIGTEKVDAFGVSVYSLAN